MLAWSQKADWHHHRVVEVIFNDSVIHRTIGLGGEAVDQSPNANISTIGAGCSFASFLSIFATRAFFPSLRELVASPIALRHVKLQGSPSVNGLPQVGQLKRSITFFIADAPQIEVGYIEHAQVLSTPTDPTRAHASQNSWVLSYSFNFAIAIGGLVFVSATMLAQ